jgi:hypothetical protein
MKRSNGEKYSLVAVKRAWCPEWLWAKVHPIALIYPFRWILTRKVRPSMCSQVLVKCGDQEVYCVSVGELAKALKLRLIEISPDEREDACLCNARFDELSARRATEAEGFPFPDYIIELK